MPTAQASLRAVSPCRNGALRPYPASASTQPKRAPAAIARSISAKAISGLDRGVWYSTGTPARFKRAASLVQLSGRNSRNVSMTGTSPRASVSDTRVWQLAVLPNAEAYCAATPTEWVPFLAIAVSSITKRKPLRHRLNALAIARADQPRDVARTHLPPRFMAQPV